MPRTPWESLPHGQAVIYKKKLRSVQTAGGHHAFPRLKLNGFCRAPMKRSAGRAPRLPAHQRTKSTGSPHVEVRYSGLLAQVKLSIGRSTHFVHHHGGRGTRNALKGPDRGSPHQILPKS